MNIRDMKKRAGSLGLVALMSLSLAAPAFAADPTKEVKGTYEAGGAPVYSYSYAFKCGKDDPMVFTYHAPSDGTWDPDTHSYTGEASAGGWTCASGANEIVVTNHSNAAISVQPEFVATYAGFKGAFFEDGSDTSFSSITIGSAVGTDKDNAPSKTFAFNPVKGTAVLTEADTAGVTLGTITLHISAA